MSKRGKKKRARCAHCDRVLHATSSRYNLGATRDHYPVPKWAGGTETVWACRLCNNLKGGMTAAEWDAFKAAHPNWWITRPRSDKWARLRARETARAKKYPASDDPRWATGYYTPIAPDDPVPGAHATRWPPDHPTTKT